MGIDRHWYRRDAISWLLLPLSGLFCALVSVRSTLYRLRLRKISEIPVPVIVVGNITVGGTGKTPLVAWLTRWLKGQGWHPGIISRGYQGQATTWPQQVRPDSDPLAVGDEPVLLAQLCSCPVAAGPDRVQAAMALLEYNDCDIVISDDGLQHYALGRDIEIAVIDGIRRLGNGWCLPAGPLREPRTRLESVDFVVCNGLPARGEYAMRLQADTVTRLIDNERQPLEAFRNTTVHAVAGIGHPERFFTMLERAGLSIIRHVFPDHHKFSLADLSFEDNIPILMTGKDAVKCRRFVTPDMWSVSADVDVDDHFQAALMQRLGEISDR